MQNDCTRCCCIRNRLQKSFPTVACCTSWTCHGNRSVAGIYLVILDRKRSLAEITLSNNVLIDDSWLWIQEVSNLDLSPTNIFLTMKIFIKLLFLLVPTTVTCFFVMTDPVSIDPQTQTTIVFFKQFLLPLTVWAWYQQLTMCFITQDFFSFTESIHINK